MRSLRRRKVGRKIRGSTTIPQKGTPKYTGTARESLLSGREGMKRGGQAAGPWGRSVPPGIGVSCSDTEGRGNVKKETPTRLVRSD